MAIVEFAEGALLIDAAVIGRGLNVEPSLVQVRMREGKITVFCEHGVDEDAGRYRLTFFHENRRFRLVIDEEGNAIQRSTVDFGDRPLPTSMRKPGMTLSKGITAVCAGSWHNWPPSKSASICICRWDISAVSEAT